MNVRLGRIHAIGAVLFAFALAASTSPSQAATEPHHLRFSNGDNITTLNPALSAETTVGLLSQLTMAYLIRYDKSNRPIPELATVVPTEKNGGISANGLTITWHLRSDAKWSDGVAFDSSDVAFSVTAMQNPANNVVSHDGFSQIASVETPNKTTAIFHLKSRFAAFMPRFFGSPPGNPALLPKHILGTLPDINHADYNALPIGIGPFRYVSWNRGDSVEMEANPYYFRGRPHLNKITYKIVTDENDEITQLQTADLDLLVNVKPSSIPRVQTIANARVLLTPSYRFVVLAFNTQHPATSDPIVRKALAMAVDRKSLVTKVNHGLGDVQESFVPSQYFAYDALPPTMYDIAAANALLDKNGWVRGADGIRSKKGKRLTIDLATVTGAYPLYVELIRSSWSQLGVELDTQTYGPTVFYQPATGIAFGGRFDATIYSIQNFPFVYPSLVYGCKRIPPNGLNIPRYCDPRLDSAMSDYEAAYDLGKQHADLTAIARSIASSAPTVVLNYAENTFVLRPDVRGFAPNAVTFFDDMIDVDI